MNRNLLKGFFLAVIALIFGVGAWLRYPLGSVERPGPGFFPLMVSSILFVLGAGMIVRARFAGREALVFNFKNIAIIIGSLAGFAVLSQWINMIVGIVFMVFCSGFAGTSYSIRRNLLVSASLVGIAFAFQKGLGLQLPLY